MRYFSALRGYTMWILSGQQTKQTLRRSCSELELLVLERTAELRGLSQQLLRVQDEERRRVARDMHDSTGQTLTALKICVGLVQGKLDKNQEIYGEISAIARLVDEALREIRTTSYLLHPPMLDESGFTSAAQWFVAGFAQRSGMKVCMDFAPELERFPPRLRSRCSACCRKVSPTCIAIQGHPRWKFAFAGESKRRSWK